MKQPDSKSVNIHITVNAPAATSVIVSPVGDQSPSISGAQSQPLGLGGLGDLAINRAKDIQSVFDTAQTVLSNTASDVQYVLNQFSGCAAAFDGIRVRVMDRVLEYSSELLQFVVRDVSDVIIAALDKLKIGKKIERDPQLRVYQLVNPYQSIWKGSNPANPDQLDEPLVHLLASPDDLAAICQTMRPLIFVHGAGYAPGPGDAFQFFQDMETQLQLFQQGPRQDLAVILVSWDSVLADADLQNILVALTVVGPVPVGVMWIVWSVYWRELERRANSAASQITPGTPHSLVEYLRVATKSQVNNPSPDYSKQLFAFSHSLGCRLWAEAVRSYGGDGLIFPDAGRWWCIEGAIPYGSFNAEGRYADQPRSYGSFGDGGKSGLRVWYSNTDAVLGALYVFATGGAAVGQWGVQGTSFPINTENVTQEAGISHDDLRLGQWFGDTRGYFTGVGARFRKALASDITPIH